MGEPVGFDEYAQVYDFMCAHVPQYAELLEVVRAALSLHFSAESEVNVVEFGSGTGNVIADALLPALPNARVTSVERNENFLNLQREKLKSIAAEGHVTFLREDMTRSQLPLGGYDCVISIHSLNFLGRDDAMNMLARACSLLQPGGLLIVADIGRPIGVQAWNDIVEPIARRQYGLRFDNEFLPSWRLAKAINEGVEAMQQRGELWMHSLEEVVQIVEAAGCAVRFASDRFYRGTDDLILAVKGGTNPA